MRRLVSTLILSILVIEASASCTVNPNIEQTIANQPILIKSVANGQRLIVGDTQNLTNYDFIHIANLRGTPYEMGEAYGQLFKDEIKDMIPTFYEYFGQQFKKVIDQNFPNFLKPIAQKNSVQLLKQLLKLNILITKRYTNPRYYQEIKGIAKSSGISQTELAAVNMLPQFVKAACTVAGIWSTASANGRTLHMRALDWDFKNPINKYPLITVYHPSNQKWQTHANIGWVGMVGSITGISEKVSLGEKVWLPPKHSVQMTRYGNPWNYVFRDILYDATNIESAIQILKNTRRTCAIHIGLGSVEDHSFKMFQYAQKRLDIFDDSNYTFTAAHPKIKGISFFDKHVQPSGDTCLGQIFGNKNYYGQWNMQNFWRIVGNSHQTGDTQLVVFDLEQMKALISYSKYNANVKAFVRKPIEVDLGKLFRPF